MSTYVGQTSRHLQQCFIEHIGVNGLLKKYYQDGHVSFPFYIVEILSKEWETIINFFVEFKTN